MKKLLKTRRPTINSLWILLLIGGLAGGCVSSKQYTFSPLPVDSSETVGLDQTKERFAAGDLVIVKFSGTSIPILDYEERIKEDGNITLPLIGILKADGKTARELEKEIHDCYASGSIRRFSVSVIDERRYYFVGGQVQLPGRQPYLGSMTVTKAIESAGGFTEFAARRRVLLTRTNGKKFRLDCRKAVQDASLDLPVYPGDKIEVPQGPPPGGISFD